MKKNGIKFFYSHCFPQCKGGLDESNVGIKNHLLKQMNLLKGTENTH